MDFTIEVNSSKIQAKYGETILSALRRNGIMVPTLCNMKEFTPTGACRLCVVEVEGMKNLITSCSFPVEEWMKIHTHSPRVLLARKTVVELLLSNHPDDCLFCERNGNCELQKLAEDMNIRERRIPGKKSSHKIDRSSPAISRDPAKCIICGRCVRICEEVQAMSCLDFISRGKNIIVAPVMGKQMNFSNCINCGQCTMVCPTAALTERIQYEEVTAALHDPERTSVVQYSPAITSAIAEAFSIKSSRDTTGIIIAALRKIGFKKVYDSSFGVDLNIMEMAEDFYLRFDSGQKLPMITGDCPAWIKYAEQNEREWLPHITRVKSPQQIMGILIRSVLAGTANIYSMSASSCTARKYESQRVEMTSSGIPDLDSVITTRELIRLIRLHGIDMDHLEPESPDEPLGVFSSGGKLAGISGGVLETLLKTIYFHYNGIEAEESTWTKLRSYKPVREVRINLGSRTIQAAAVSGMSGVIGLLDDIRQKKRSFDIIEIMACPGGCIAGGGQPIPADENAIRNRIKAIYENETRDLIRTAHNNPGIEEIYKKYFFQEAGINTKERLYVEYSGAEV
jgi:NADH-quinone oxidoreductase subunit G/NADP-reducing hydrogenase subunit HndD